MRWCILAFFLFFSFPLIAQQNGTISGFIFDADSVKSLTDVNVFIESLNLGSVTNQEGFFQIRSVPAGSHQVRVTALGYQSKIIAVAVKPGSNTQLEIELKADIRRLGEVVITDERMQYQVISKQPYVLAGFSKPVIQQQSSADIGEFLRSSQNISGIRKGATQIDPVVRGFKFSQLNVVLNGGQKIEGGCPNRMDPATGHVEIEDVESIHIVKGPYDLRYGAGLGALIDISTTEQPLPDSGFIMVEAMKSFESNWNGNREHIKVTGGNHRVFMAASAGRKSYGNYTDGNGNEINSAFKKYNYKGLVGFRPYKNHLLLLAAEEAKGRNIRFPALPMDERKDDTRLLSADYKITGTRGALNFIALKAYQSAVRHEMDNKYRPFSDTTVAISIIHAKNTGGRAEIGLQTALGELVMAADYEIINKDGRRDKNMILQPGLPVKEEKLWNHSQITNTGFYALLHGESARWNYYASTRIDLNKASSDKISIMHPMFGEIYNYHTDSIDTRFINLSLSGGVSLKVNNLLSISLAAARATRSPDMTERFIILLPIGYDQFDYLGDPQLQPETNNQVDITLKFALKKYGSLQVNGFYALVNNFITGRRLPPAVQKPLSKDVLGVKQFYNAGHARLRGFELSWASPAKHRARARLLASYTYGTLDEVLQYQMNESGEVIDDELLLNDALTEIPPFEATLHVDYRLFNNRFTPSINLRAVAAQNHVSKAAYEAATPGFLLAGVGFNYHFNQYFNISGGIKNLFNEAYYEHLNRNIIGSAVSLHEPGRSFFVNLFIKF